MASERIELTRNGVTVGWCEMDSTTGAIGFLEIYSEYNYLFRSAMIPGMSYSIAGKDLGVKDEQS